MTDVFSAFAQIAIPKSVQRKQAKQDKAPTQFEVKMAEKQRLNRAYRCWRRDHVRAVLATEPRLRDFTRYLKTVQAGDGDSLIEALRDSWLVQAAEEVRVYALRLVDARCDKINRDFNIAPLDDPTPPESSVYFRARAVLYFGGRT